MDLSIIALVENSHGSNHDFCFALALLSMCCFIVYVMGKNAATSLFVFLMGNIAVAES